jgi:hypothetical protein
MSEAFKVIAGAALSMALALSAGADTAQDQDIQSTDLRWEQLRDQYTEVDSSDAGRSADFFGFSRTIQTAGTTGPLIVFLCHVSSEEYESLNVAIQLDPHSTYGENPERAPRILTLSGILTVDGKKQSERFRYHPASSKIVPFDRKVAKRLYNAAVTGADVSIKVQGKTHNLEIPAKNDVFVSFAKICPVTNGGTFDRSIFDGAEG